MLPWSLLCLQRWQPNQTRRVEELEKGTCAKLMGRIRAMKMVIVGQLLLTPGSVKALDKEAQKSQVYAFHMESL